MPNMFGEWSDGLGHPVHLLAAFLLALPIGWNRNRAKRGAGIRTFPVAMASCGFVQTGDFGPGRVSGDPGQYPAGRRHRRRLYRCWRHHAAGRGDHRHATAASIRTVGIIGAAVGFGCFEIGVILAVANLVVLKLKAPLAGARIAAPVLNGGQDEGED